MPVQPQRWRREPGFLRPGLSDIETIQTLIGDFLIDRHSPHLFSGRKEPINDVQIEQGWGGSAPLEKVVTSDEDLHGLLSCPKTLRQSLCILEPADHVGENSIGEGVRASLNVACLAQAIADCDSILFPLWSTEKLNPQLLVEVLSSCLAVVVEGGHPTVKDSTSFQKFGWGHTKFLELCEDLLLSRQSRTPSSLFICLGHQLIAQAHIRLIKRATTQILENVNSILDGYPHLLSGLESVCNEIIDVGSNLEVIKAGNVVARGWDDPHFAVALNEVPEVGHCELIHYDHPGLHPNKDFSKLLLAHIVSSEAYDGIVEHSISYEKNLNIVMFHSDEVNEEAILFANWAYRKLHDRLLPARKLISVSNLSWLLKMPNAVEILCSTLAQGKLCTEVAATCISYLDFETNHVRRSFSCQFHPELLDDLREFRLSGMPRFSDLKKDDGVRLLMRIFYEAMND